MAELKTGTISLEVSEKDGAVRIIADGIEWRSAGTFPARLECEEGTFLFSDACKTEVHCEQTGVGAGIRCRYEGFIAEGKSIPYSFETWIWVENMTGAVRFEWIPLCEDGLFVKRVLWPEAFDFSAEDSSWITLLPARQGLCIPNGWPNAVGKMSFDGRFETAGGFMSWFGQIKKDAGYCAVCETPWNAGYTPVHEAGEMQTRVSAWWEPSLGKMAYRRILTFYFKKSCTMVDLAGIYRDCMDRDGRLVTLAEKAARVPEVKKLVGCAFVHQGIKTAVQPDSAFFDPADPEKNNHVTSFSARAEGIRSLHEKGVEKLYLHLDGWGDAGYDNKHPDVTPACEEAGGFEGMKYLQDTLHACGYLFGIHDQYRDYYHAAASYDPDYAVMLPDGSEPSHNHWAGGPQSYLCASQAPYFVRRNFSILEEHGIHPDCAYLDVFTCNEGDECDNPRHRMTRKDCYDYRGRCFNELLHRHILSSSEEASDWAIPSLVFCHYAPYDFMLEAPGTPKAGIPVPLYSLIYHDCVLVPWMMEKDVDGVDLMLYALLNGGAPYLIRDGAYPNTDGSFGGEKATTLEEDIERSRIVSHLHEEVAFERMTDFVLLSADGSRQKSTFANGTSVTIDLNAGTYQIEKN